MSEAPFIGEIRMFAGNFAPSGWASCNGQVLAIAEHDALFVLIGTTYGGDGEETFALPDLRGRLPLHQQAGAFTVGNSGGVEEVTLTALTTPAHRHALVAAAGVGAQNSPLGALHAETPGGIYPYIEDAPSSAMASQAVGVAGGSQPHTNLQPYLSVNFIISLYGEFPQQT